MITDKLYEFNLKQKKHKIIKFVENEVNVISIDARTLVEEKEKDM